MTRILNNNKALIVIIVILLLTNIVLMSFFLGMKNPPQKDVPKEERPPRTSTILKNDIGFSEHQMNRYDSLKKEHWQSIKPLFRGISTMKDRFYLNLKDSVINDGELDNLADSIGMKQKEIDRRIFNYFRSIRELCTPEQIPAYDSLIQKSVKRMINPNGRGEWKRPDSTQQKIDATRK